MLEWASGGSERTFDQSAANSRKEPRVPDAALLTNGRFHLLRHLKFDQCSVPPSKVNGNRPQCQPHLRFSAVIGPQHQPCCVRGRLAEL